MVGLPFAGETEADFALEVADEPTTTGAGWEPEATRVFGPAAGFFDALAADA